MKESLEFALDKICSERDSGEYSETFDAVFKLVCEYGENDLANRIFDDIPRDIPHELVSDLLNLLIWNTTDNGLALCKEKDEWLREASDNRKILVALAVDVHPFPSYEEMESVLKNLLEVKPKFKKKCLDLIQNRKLLQNKKLTKQSN